MKKYFFGIDVGTQGVRIVLVDQDGAIAGNSEKSFPLTDYSREEQSPDFWWDACQQCLTEIVSQVKTHIDLAMIQALSVTSTSGTVIPLDENNEPLHPALMYSDGRSVDAGKLCRQVAEQFHPTGYTGFNASSGLSKMVWFTNQFPEKTSRIKTWIHAADFIIGKLSGNFGVTDYTNALKSGFDVSRGQWPDYLFSQLPLKKQWFQKVVPSGTVIGSLLPELSKAFQLPVIQIVAGMTDGCASQVASGAVNPGNWNTTIGTTLVIKGVTIRELKDPEGRLYSHRHPEGYWMPGGAGNIGADWITAGFAKDLEHLNQAAEALIPTRHMAYPLLQKGERFPFIASQARGFAPEHISREALFTANMEGVAYIERYAYALIEKLSNEKVKAVYTAGGGSNSEAWLKIRSNVLNKPVYKCTVVTGAVGAAILAASNTHFKSLTEAASAMTRIEKEVIPTAALVHEYEWRYQQFIAMLIEKEYIVEKIKYAD